MSILGLESSVVMAIAASTLLAVSAGIYGTAMVARRMALFGDMIAHAVLPGVAFGLLIAPAGSSWLILLCAVLAGLAAVGCHIFLLKHLRPDAALAAVLAVFFAAGLALISARPVVGAQNFLFGQVAAVTRTDLAFLALLASLSVLLLLAAFPALRNSWFDPVQARLGGLAVARCDLLLLVSFTLLVVGAMQAIGVVLVTAYLVTPAALALRLVNRLASAMVLAVVIALVASGCGIAISLAYPAVPTGAAITLCLAALFGLSLLWPCQQSSHP